MLQISARVRDTDIICFCLQVDFEHPPQELGGVSNHFTPSETKSVKITHVSRGPQIGQPECSRGRYIQFCSVLYDVSNAIGI